MKNRLIELIRQARKKTKDANSTLEREMIFAEYLLANGVIVPPCKVGDYIEWETGLQLRLYRVNGFIYHTNDSVFPLRYDLDDIQPIITHCAIKRILTKEEAEQALKGGAE